MNITIKDKEYELLFDIGFAETLDKKYSAKQYIGEHTGVEFGLGVQMINAKLLAGDIRGIKETIKAGLEDVKTVTYSEKDLNKAVSEKAKELGGFQALSEELRNGIIASGLFNHIFETEMTEEEAKKILTENQSDE